MDKFFEINETKGIEVLLRDEDSLLLGAKNSVFNISLETLEGRRIITWAPSAEDESACKEQGRTDDQCQNYIKLLAHRDNNELLVCGTNAFNPSCHTYYTDNNATSFIIGGDSGIAKVSYSRTHKSTALYVRDQLFTATFVDVEGREPIIYSESHGSFIRTALNQAWLNEPDFVSTFEHIDKVYFVFRESVQDAAFGEKVSRIARVCKNDQGGQGHFKNIWTSYFKARLNCSIPGKTPFYMDALQTTTALAKGNYRPSLLYSSRTAMFYAVFHAQNNGIPGSAVCAFRMTDISKSFKGFFRKQRPSKSSRLTVPFRKTPIPHPAETCANESMTLSSKTMKFIHEHPLMYKSIPPYGGLPIIVSFTYGMTTIAVDWQVKASDGKYYDVLFIGTNDGCVIKVINKGAGFAIMPHIIEQVLVFSDNSPVTNVHIYKKQKVAVLGRGMMKVIPLSRCHMQGTCEQCVGLHDPYCSWNDEGNQCIHSTLGLQNLHTGKHPQCYKGVVKTEVAHEQLSTNLSVSPTYSDGYSALNIMLVGVLSQLTVCLLDRLAYTSLIETFNMRLSVKLDC